MSDQLVDLSALHGTSERVLADMRAYAKRIGCRVVADEIECHTEEQSRKLGDWWTEHARG